MCVNIPSNIWSLKNKSNKEKKKKKKNKKKRVNGPKDQVRRPQLGAADRTAAKIRNENEIASAFFGFCFILFKSKRKELHRTESENDWPADAPSSSSSSSSSTTTSTCSPPSSPSVVNCLLNCPLPTMAIEETTTCGKHERTNERTWTLACWRRHWLLHLLFLFLPFRFFFVHLVARSLKKEIK